MRCEKCQNYKPIKLKRWENIWEVCDDFKYGKTGTMPIWVCLFVPIIAPIIYLLLYYGGRKRKS